MQLHIKQPLGVSGVGEDTRTIAELSASECFDGCRVLELGTGTGYVAIFLSKFGYSVDATDINPKAIKTASENAKLNKVNINFFHSDLFGNVKGTYDLIVFNAPICSTNETMKSFVRKIPFINLFRPLYLKVSKSRNELIEKFLAESKKHLRKGGKIILNTDDFIENGFAKIKHVKKPPWCYVVLQARE